MEFSASHGMEITGVDELIAPGFRAPFLVSVFLQVACAMIHQNLVTSLCSFFRGLSLLFHFAQILRGSYKTWTGLWTGFWTGLWNACELSFKLVEMQVEMLKTAVV